MASTLLPWYHLKGIIKGEKQSLEKTVNMSHEPPSAVIAMRNDSAVYAVFFAVSLFWGLFCFGQSIQNIVQIIYWSIHVAHVALKDEVQNFEKSGKSTEYQYEGPAPSRTSHHKRIAQENMAPNQGHTCITRKATGADSCYKSSWTGEEEMAQASF